MIGRREFNGDTAVAWPIAARAAVGDAGNGYLRRSAECNIDPFSALAT
jgi:hypothetical protein